MLLPPGTATILFSLSPLGSFENFERSGVLLRDKFIVGLELFLLLIWESQLFNLALATLPLLEQLLKLSQRVIVCSSRGALFQLADLQFSQSLVFIEDFWLIVQLDRKL